MADEVIRRIRGHRNIVQVKGHTSLDDFPEGVEDPSAEQVMAAEPGARDVGRHGAVAAEQAMTPKEPGPPTGSGGRSSWGSS